MPSFRVTMTVGALRPGVRPDRVLPQAAEAAAVLTVVEASSVAVVAGSARITVRFMADNAAEAVGFGDRIVAGTAELAEIITWVVTERVQGRWYPRR